MAQFRVVVRILSNVHRICLLYGVDKVREDLFGLEFLPIVGAEFPGFFQVVPFAGRTSLQRGGLFGEGQGFDIHSFDFIGGIGGKFALDLELGFDFGFELFAVAEVDDHFTVFGGGFFQFQACDALEGEGDFCHTVLEGEFGFTAFSSASTEEGESPFAESGYVVNGSLHSAHIGDGSSKGASGV